MLQIEKRFSDAEERLRSLRTELAARYPVYRQMSGAGPVRYEELKALADQHPDTLYLEWGVGQEKTSSLFALSQKDGLKSFTLQSGEDDLHKRVRAWRDALSEPEAPPAAEAGPAASLYETLFGEIEKAGLLAPQRYSRLVLVGDGPLREMPFAALLDKNGKRLIERFPLTVSISLGVLTWPDDRPKSLGTLLCMADPVPQQAPAFKGGDFGDLPPLPAARAEGKALGAIIPGAVVLIGSYACKGNVTKAMERYSLLHFATHGYLDDEDGLRSGLVLSADGNVTEPVLLEARELINMRLSAQLAVLSACDTGEGQRSGGEGLLGLTWAFRAAGCPSVVASLWSVDDAATGQLMVGFYQGLKAGKRKDDALRDAMLAVKDRQPRPFYWSAFQVTGDAAPVKL